jgi:predicted O-methyltransferase YrrM
MDFLKLKSLMTQAINGERNHLFTDVINELHCMSTARVYAIINTIVSSLSDHENYVEVGTYQGGSLISALLGNNIRAIGVDSFGQFTETNNLQTTKANLEKFGVADRVTMHDKGFKEFFAELPATFPIHVYYYDGAHDEQAQYEGMEAAWPHLRPGSIVIVDDYTYPPVQRAVNRFVANHISTIKFLFMFDPIFNTDPIWWNGCVVLRVTDELGGTP